MHVMLAQSFLSYLMSARELVLTLCDANILRKKLKIRLTARPYSAWFFAADTGSDAE